MIKFTPFYCYDYDEEKEVPDRYANPVFFRAHPTFLEQLCRQVTRELERLIGVPAFGKDVFFGGHLSGELIYKNGHDYMFINTGFYAWHADFLIEWKSKKEPGRRIDVSEEVGPDDIEFTIPDIPWPDSDRYPNRRNHGFLEPFKMLPNGRDYTLADVHRMFSRPTRVIKGAKSGRRFDVEVWVPEWPDAEIVVRVDGATEETVEAIDECLGMAEAEWNEAQERKKGDRQLIHYTSEGELTEEGIVYQVDFGGCKTLRAFNTMCDALDKLEGVPITRVIIRQLS